MKTVFERFSHDNKKYHTKECEWCHGFFEIDYTAKNKKYCSDECRSSAIHAKRKPLFCSRCGIELEWKRYPVKYCSSCRSIARSESQKCVVHTSCGYCGKEIAVIPSVFEKNKFNYCDKECMAKHYAEIYTGENSPTWKGGKRHYQGGWLKSRDAARKRDRYTCQMCGITEELYGQEMSVHHIKNYRFFEDKFEANNLSNLICLCEPCHRFIHSNENSDSK